MILVAGGMWYRWLPTVAPTTVGRICQRWRTAFPLFQRRRGHSAGFYQRPAAVRPPAVTAAAASGGAGAGGTPWAAAAAAHGEGWRRRGGREGQGA